MKNVFVAEKDFACVCVYVLALAVDEIYQSIFIATYQDQLQILSNFQRMLTQKPKVC